MAPKTKQNKTKKHIWGMIKSLWKLNVIMVLLRFFKYLLSEEMEETSSLTYGLHSWVEDTDEQNQMKHRQMAQN